MTIHDYNKTGSTSEEITLYSNKQLRTGTQEYIYRKEGDLPMESSLRGWYLVLVIRDIAQYVNSLARINF